VAQAVALAELLSVVLAELLHTAVVVAAEVVVPQAVLAVEVVMA
jgi:hypothetical protein